MMTARNQTYRKIALALAFLVFISTTGVGMQAHWCGCINQWSLRLLPSNGDCCKAKPKLDLSIPSCCAAQFSQDKLGISKNNSVCAAPSSDIALQGCCYEVFKYAKSDLVGQEVTFSEAMPIFVQLALPIYFYTTIETTLPALWQEGQIKSIPNKAPPRFGNNYRHWIQVYRC